MQLPSVNVVFNRKGRKNKKGLYPIYLRITIDRESKYYTIPVPQKIAPSDWNGTEDIWVKPRHPFAFEINNKIREKKNLVLDLIKRNYTFNKSLGFETIFQHLSRRGDRNSFYEYMHNYIISPPERLEENTLKKYNTTLTHLKKFRKQLHFSDIDSSMVREFFKYMQTELNLGGAACKKYMEAFKKVVRHARKDNYLDPSQMEFLFDDVKIRVKKSKRTFLEPAEIKAWKNAAIPPRSPSLERDRDLFLFLIYTGYYYKDLPIFTKDQLIEDDTHGSIILGARDKNGNQTIIPLFKFPYAATILRKYKSVGSEKKIFDPAFLVEEPVFNRNLKIIAKLAGITKTVTNKVARHTNAQLWVRYGAERQVISKMMGHTREETTTNYFDVNIPEVIEGTKRVNFKNLGI